MAKYKIESPYLQFPIIIETESNNDAFRIFIAYCDFYGIDSDDVECMCDNTGIIYAKAQPELEDDEEEDVEFIFKKNEII